MENSIVWKFFKKKVNDTSVCSLCAKIISCKGRSTSGLMRHLKSLHKTSWEKEKAERESQEELPPKIRKTQPTLLHSYTDTKDVSTIVAKLAAVDGFSIRAITRSEYIRQSMVRDGLNLPKAEWGVQQLIIKKFLEVKDEFIKNINSKLEEGRRFSLTMDEWTSLKNRKYLNICLLCEGQTFYNLGMVYIPGKCGAAEIKQLVETRLAEYNVQFEKHIVFTITDGPNVMKKFVKDSPVDGIFCLNHAIHLAVIDVFYKKETIFCDSEPESNDSSDDFEDDFEDVFQDFTNDVFINSNYKEVLDQTRRIVKLFKKSTTKNAILQKYVVEEHKKELSLELDIVTRWNSMVPMMDKFLLLKNSIKKSLIDLEMGELWIEENIITLNNMLKVLKPIKVAVERLSSRDTNILTADAIVNTLCEEIQSIPSVLGEKMFQALYLRIDERRDKKLYTLVKYLKEPDFFNNNHEISVFSYASKYSVIGYAENLLNRLFGGSNDIEEITNNTDVEECAAVEKKTFEEVLNTAINNVNVCSQFNSKNTSKYSIKKEFKFFEGSGHKTPNIEYLFNALLTVRPTSVESERVFSVTGQFVNKIRNRLSDDSINALSVLKNYFLSRNKNVK